MLDGVRDAVFEPLIEADERQEAEKPERTAVHGMKVR